MKVHVKTKCNYGEGIQLRAGQDAPPTVSVAHFLNMSQDENRYTFDESSFHSRNGHCKGNRTMF